MRERERGRGSEGVTERRRKRAKDGAREGARVIARVIYSAAQVDEARRQQGTTGLANEYRDGQIGQRD